LGKGTVEVTGSELFWASGTYWLILGQFLFLIVVLIIYFYQRQQEHKAEERQDRTYREDQSQEIT
jgi:preprotein translocase subunit YajC